MEVEWETQEEGYIDIDIHIHIHIADSCYCTAETNTTL